MRRILAALFAITLTFAAVTTVSVSSAASPAAAQTVAQSGEQSGRSGSSSSSAAGSPSIVPKPSDDGTSNLGGLAVGALLLGGWFAFGAVLFIKGKRRRDLQQA